VDTSARRRTAVFVVPLILAVVIMGRVAENVRTVDFLQILGCGMIIGVSLAGLIRTLKTPKP
jgi:hypothetical protein